MDSNLGTFKVIDKTLGLGRIDSHKIKACLMCVDVSLNRYQNYVFN